MFHTFIWAALVTALAFQNQTPVPKQASQTSIDSYVEAMRVFQEFTLPMAMLVGFVVLVVVFGMNVYYNRNRGKESSEAIKVMSNLIQEIQAEKIDIREDANELALRNVENMTVVSDAINRMADLQEQNKELLAKVVQADVEQNTDMTAMKMALDTMVNEGSEPLRALAADVKIILGYFQTLDTPKGNWQKIIEAVPGIRTTLSEMETKLNTALAYAQAEQKRATQTTPIVEVPAGSSLTVEAVPE